MSRISKWKLEKTKVKVVFRLQFHATHIPQSGWDKLFISFIPTDSGKTTAKTTKANVRNGTCKWADPIYETTRLLQDSKTKQYDEKLYKIVVAMGSSRASTLGEATINLADYVDALKPSSVSLPLHGCNFGTILHITVQLLTSKTGFREFEQQRELREGGLQSGVNSHGHIAYSEEGSARRNFKADASELSSLDEDANLNEECSSNTSESLYAEKHETSSPHEIDSLKSTTSGDIHMISQNQSPSTGKTDPSDKSMDNELAMACEENSRLKGSLELTESSLFNLKLEVNSLQSVADEVGTETQKFSRLLAAEVSLSEQLAKEVSVMKSECLKFKADIVKLRDLKFSHQIPVMETSNNQVDHIVRNMQLQYIEGIAVVEGKIRELQNKAYIVPIDGDSKSIYLELESLLNFLMEFKLGYGLPSEEIKTKDEQCVVSGNGLGLDLCQPESVLLNLTSSVSGVVNPVNVIDAMKGQIFDLVRELDEAKVEKEALVRKMDQMECYYEALIQEIEENQKRLLGELQHVTNEHSNCLYTLSANRAEIESVHQDMNEQMLRFVDERNDLEAINKELEKRATTSESALRRARLNYSIAVDKLQKDLELLSSQVMSMFETNENLIKQALPSQPHLNRALDAGDDYDAKLSTAQNEDSCLSKRSVGGDILVEDLKRSFCMQEELYQKVEQELLEMHSVNLGLDIYSKALQESLCEANDEMGIMKEKIGELVEELKLSNASQNKLMVRLQKATDDIHTLSEFKSSSISQCSDMALQNQLLEDKLVNISEENDVLLQKVKDFEDTMMEYRSYKSKYGDCLAEKSELSHSLKQEEIENEKLTNEISLLKQKFKGEIQEMDTKLHLSNALVEKLQFKLESVANKLHLSSEIEEKHAQQNKVILTDLALLEDQMHELTCKDGYLDKENTGLDAFALTITELIHDKQELTMFLQDKTEESKKLLCEISCLKENLRSLHDELDKEKGYKDELEGKFRDLSKDQDKLLDFEHQKDELVHVKKLASDLELERSRLSHLLDELSHSLKQEEFEKENLKNEISLLVEKLTVLEANQKSEIMTMEHKYKGEIQDMVSKLELSNALVEKLEAELESVAYKLNLSSEIEEKHAQQSKVLLADYALLENQVHELTCTDGHLDREIKGWDGLAEEFQMSKITITELIHDKQEFTECIKDKDEELMKLSCEMSCLKENLRNLHDELNKEKSCKDELEEKIRDLSKDQDKLLNLEQEKAELMHVRKMVLDLELEKSRLSRLLDQQNVLIEKIRGNNFCQASLESQLLEMHEYSLEAEVKHTYVANQYEERLEELHSQLMSSEVCFEQLQKRYRDLEAMLNDSIEREAHWSEEKANLLTTLKSLKSDLEVSEAQNKLLSDSNNDITEQLDECHKKLTMTETNFSLDKSLQASEMEHLKSMIIGAEEEINYLTVAKEELEILVIVLKSKVDEQSGDVVLVEEYKDELTRLRLQCSELSLKLSEQVKKTEEFKNLSTHLKELNDKAEKRESEAQPVVAQDSLRIAFIKEQYETKVQELKQQLSVSKKHGEEMLMKLQDAIDEIENRKKSEAVYLKRNEEISVKLLAFEEELQSVLVEKREKSNAYDRIKAELECALLSLECCKEEKEKLEAVLVEFEAQKSRLETEITSIKGQLEIVQDATQKGMDKNPEKSILEELPQSNGNNLVVNGEHLGAQKLRSSMEHLHEELEKMKNENTVFNIDHDVDPGFKVQDREIMQLNKANDELRSMFPLFNEISSGGNALERVLALEIELAEAMKTKNRLNVQFQSSFLKQHSDEEAVLKSFRDINELIKEMLELKERHGSMEAELRDMHQRYSQLSLQFAEVDGERQRLKMTLKSVRSSRNLNRSSSANLTMDHTP